MYRDFQKNLFFQIRQKDPYCHKIIPPLLGIGKSAYYKRVRGETEMRIGEVIMLLEMYELESIKFYYEDDKLPQD